MFSVSFYWIRSSGQSSKRSVFVDEEDRSTKLEKIEKRLEEQVHQSKSENLLRFLFGIQEINFLEDNFERSLSESFNVIASTHKPIPSKGTAINSLGSSRTQGIPFSRPQLCRSLQLKAFQPKPKNVVRPMEQLSRATGELYPHVEILIDSSRPLKEEPFDSPPDPSLLDSFTDLYRQPPALPTFTKKPFDAVLKALSSISKSPHSEEKPVASLQEPVLSVNSAAANETSAIDTSHVHPTPTAPTTPEPEPESSPSDPTIGETAASNAGNATAESLQVRLLPGGLRIVYIASKDEQRRGTSRRSDVGTGGDTLSSEDR